MSNNYYFDVSVVIVTYNPDTNKLISTIQSIIKQKNIGFEIIISDDGSKNVNFEKVRSFFEAYCFKNYKILENKDNQGTVRNILAGLSKAVGKYVYTTSPGDFLFDENVLKDFYDFAEANHSKVVFGNAVYYSLQDKNIDIYCNMSAPLQPSNFNLDKSIFTEKIAFFFGGNILGAVFFRERECALKYINKIKKDCKYVEDNTSTAYVLADNIRVDYYDRNMIWYEYGTGISTSKNNDWNLILDKEFEKNFISLKKEFSKDPVIDAAWYYTYINKGKLTDRLYRLFKHPVITILKIILYVFTPKRIVQCSAEDKKRLEKLLSVDYK